MPLCPPRRFQTAKAGNRPDECEDASRVIYSVHANEARIALCDGASESAFVRSWAQILVDAFVRRPLDLSEPQRARPDRLAWAVRKEMEPSRAVGTHSLAWRGQDAGGRPGGTAGPYRRPTAQLLGRLFLASRGRWRLLSFCRPRWRFATRLPYGFASQFNNTPSLICSNPANNRGLWGRVGQLRGEFRSGDVVILSSDALAAWLLQEYESGGRPWEILLSLTHAQWGDWVQERRAERSMRNDDTTAIIIPVT